MATVTGLLGYGASRVPRPKQDKKEWQVQPNQTVAAQVDNLVRSDSPLMQQAAGQAQQQMNARGLLNSSLAIGASQDAVIRNALPIAQQDAQTWARAGEFNVGQSNAWNLAQQEMNQADRRIDLDAGIRGVELDQRANQFDRDLASRFDLKRMEQAHAREMESFRSRAERDAGFSKQYELYTDAAFKIDNDPDLSAEAKTARKNMQLQILRNYAQVRNLGLDLNFLRV